MEDFLFVLLIAAVHVVWAVRNIHKAMLALRSMEDREGQQFLPEFATILYVDMMDLRTKLVYFNFCLVLFSFIIIFFSVLF